MRYSVITRINNDFVEEYQTDDDVAATLRYCVNFVRYGTGIRPINLFLGVYDRETDRLIKEYEMEAPYGDPNSFGLQP